ncbi:hypothetical protein ACFQ14_03915 [Pseudahrensia aquimaris]|uniref:Uncharacterized protein n=1 Tax=Pseudahrensia aquimaris TaxID=744461 RepID=A0ABW3FDC9_9HYPH
MSTSTDQLVSKIGDLVNQPHQYDGFIEEWRRHIADLDTVEEQHETDRFTIIETAALKALSDMSERDDKPEGSQVVNLEMLKTPAFCISARGTILALNDAAWATYQVEIGNSV